MNVETCCAPSLRANERSNSSRSSRSDRCGCRKAASTERRATLRASRRAARAAHAIEQGTPDLGLQNPQIRHRDPIHAVRTARRRITLSSTLARLRADAVILCLGCGYRSHTGRAVGPTGYSCKRCGWGELEPSALPQGDPECEKNSKTILDYESNRAAQPATPSKRC